jgi:hypothetical protein
MYTLYTLIGTIKARVRQERLLVVLTGNSARVVLGGGQTARRGVLPQARSLSTFRRCSTGEVANPAFLKFAFPPRYHYVVLRALDYLRGAGAAPDARAPKNSAGVPSTSKV